MAQDKQSKIITYLINQSDWVTTGDIASAFNISVRSVKYIVSTINKEYPDLITSTNKGYKIDKEKALKAISNQKENDIPNSYSERKRYIINTLLLQKQTQTITSLSDALSISPITLQNELSKIRTELADYHLNVHIKKDVVTITGVEKDKRAILLSLINEEIKETYYSFDRIQTIFNDINIDDIHNIVIKVLNKYQYFLDNYSLLNYVLHLALTITLKGEYEESKESNTIDEQAFSKLTSPHINMIVKDIYDELKKKYKTNYNLYDIYESSMLMMTKVVSSGIDEISYQQVKELVGERVTNLLNVIVDSVFKTYHIKMENSNFLVRFAFHIKNLLVRLEQKISIVNLQFDTIKNSYPLLYTVSAYIANIIQNESGYLLPEDEIAYITLHLGMMLDEDRAKKERVKAILVCPDYQGIGKKAFAKLNSIYSENLLITDFVTSLSSEQDLSNIELVISTVPIVVNQNVRHYIIEPFISERDIKEIFKYIDDIKNERMKKFIRDKVSYFFHEDLFFTNENFLTDVQAIEKMTNTMIEKGYVDKNYKTEIYEHEAIAPSSYGNIAIPHPLGVVAKSSVIAISINPQPIHWGMNQVNLVFMLSLKEEDKDLFTDIFNFVTNIIKDEKVFNRIMNVKSFDEFINLLVSSY